MNKLFRLLIFLSGLLALANMLLSVVCAAFAVVGKKENINKILDDNYTSERTEAGVRGAVNELVDKFSAVEDYKKSLNDAMGTDGGSQDVSPEVESMIADYNYSNIIGQNVQINKLLEGSSNVVDTLGNIMTVWNVLSGEEKNSWLLLSALNADGYFSQNDIIELLADENVKDAVSDETIKEENIIAFSGSRMAMHINTETHYLMLDYVANAETLDGWQERYENSISDIVSGNKSDFELLFGRELTDSDTETLNLIGDKIIEYMLDKTESPDTATSGMNSGLKVFFRLAFNWYLAAIVLGLAFVWLLIDALLQKNAGLILSYGAFSAILTGGASILVHFLKNGKTLDKLVNGSNIFLYVGIGYVAAGVLLIVIHCIIKSVKRRKHTEMLRRISAVDIHAMPDNKN